MAKKIVQKNTKEGTIVQILGVVLDIQFSSDYIPAIYEALEVASPFTTSKTLILEVEQHLGDYRVRTVALGPTDGLKRGQK